MTQDEDHQDFHTVIYHSSNSSGLYKTKLLPIAQICSAVGHILSCMGECFKIVQRRTKKKECNCTTVLSRKLAARVFKFPLDFLRRTCVQLFC